MCSNFYLKIYGLLYFTTSISSRSITTENYPIATTSRPIMEFPLSRYERGLEDYDEMQARQGKGMLMEEESYDHDHDHDHDHAHEMKETKTDMSEQKATANDAWASYYDFIINEGSFKFWAAFQLVTAALLIYSALAAVYYAKFNVITTDYDYYYDFFGRSDNGRSMDYSENWFGMNTQTFQRILDAISSKKYS